MDVATGKLYRINSAEELMELKEMFGEALQFVPNEHEEEAEVELGDKECTIVDMNKDTPLTAWAKQKKKSNKKKMTKQSKKVNRKK